MTGEAQLDDYDSIWCRDLDGTGSLHMCSVGDPGAIEFVPRDAACPAPQPGADTRVVTLQEAAQILYDTMKTNRPLFDAMVEAAEDIELTGVSFNRVVGDALCAAIGWKEPAIIGTATPAQPDKIAEAARDKTAAELVIDAYDAANPFRQADMHPALCHCNRCAIDWMRALAGKGE